MNKNKSKTIIMESFLSNLYDYYNDDDNATNFINSNIKTPEDLEVFAIKHNIDVEFTSQPSEYTTEEFQLIIDKEKMYEVL